MADYLSTLLAKTKEKGLVNMAKSAMAITTEKANVYQEWLKFKATRSGATFTLDGHTYRYFYHPYNFTWRNERCVEVAVVLDMIKARRGSHVLELGNVLPFYSSYPHTVLDKYEQGPGVINQDVVEYKPDKKFDLIVSISTMEHVGFDEEVKQPEKILQAFDLLKDMLNIGGELMFTFPLGYNNFLDQYAMDGSLKADKIMYLKRINAIGDWHEVSADEAKSVAYGHPFSYANAVGFVSIRKGA